MRKNKMGDSKLFSTNMLEFFSFIALIITAILLLVHNLPITLSDNIKNILSTIKDLIILLIIGLNGWKFVKDKGKTFRVIFLVALFVFILSIAFVWIF